MLTVIVIASFTYICRGPLIWISARMAAFAVGFVIGWSFMERR